tara:strand:- start:82 stop:327 length:246 start_codon:yes stop_codon:yes gene_type:complete
MRWPPNAAWTSAVKREGYRHFEVKSYGGKKDERWVELFPVNNNEILIRVPWSELKTYSKWTSGWLQLPKDDCCDGNQSTKV